MNFPERLYIKRMFFKAIVSILAFLFFIVIVNSIVNGVFLKKTLEIEVVPPLQNDVWQVFYDLGKGYREADSSIIQVSKSNGAAKVVLDLFYLKIHALRIDPGTHVGNILIRSMTYKVGASSKTWHSNDLVKEFKPLNQIGAFAESNGELRIRSRGNDPYFVYSGDFGKIDEGLSGKYESGRLYACLFGLILAFGLFCLL